MKPNFAEDSIQQEEITLNFSHNNENDFSNNNFQESAIGGLHQLQNIGSDNNNQIQIPNQQSLNNLNNQGSPQNNLNNNSSILHDDTILIANLNSNESQLNATQLLPNNPISYQDSAVRDIIYSILKSHTVGFLFFIFIVLNVKFNISYYYAIIFLWLVDIYNIVTSFTSLSESHG